MIAPITRRDVIAHQSVVPWPSQIQVEQDLLLCRAMVALFDDAFLQEPDCYAAAARCCTRSHLAPPAIQ